MNNVAFIPQREKELFSVSMYKDYRYTISVKLRHEGRPTSQR